MVVAQHCEGTKSHGIVHFKMIRFMLCEFYLTFFFKADLFSSPKQGTGNMIPLFPEG